MINILHFTYDYPSAVTPDKTPAVLNLIKSVENSCGHFVVNLNRVNSFNKESFFFNNNLAVINTFGLPKGMFFRFTLHRALKNINTLKKTYDIDFNKFNLIHSHKLCFEGPIAYNYSLKHNIPFIISVRTFDFPVLKYRIDLRSFYKKILLAAKQIIFISPWMENFLADIIGTSFYNSYLKNKTFCLGSIINLNYSDKLTIAFDKKQSVFKFVTVMKISELYIKVKNIRRVLESLSKLEIPFMFDIIGTGDSGSVKKLNKMIEKYRLNGKVRLTGYVENRYIADYLKQYDAYIMPSYPETLGMAFIEALNAGVPVIYSQNAGIDGFFDDSIGIKVNPFDINSIYQGIKKIIDLNSVYKSNIKSLIECGGLDRFKSEYVGKNYFYIINKAVE
ncbi:glycosyltransferase family 4 protein [Candidatus Dependentiae bacterium]|nr:glycosyltransferase family 4 protein [Candidatus Dependentiae bacterium]